MFGIVLCLFFVNANCHNVKLQGGLILGKSELTIFEGNFYYAFYRVPYAKPPVRRLRFKNPSPLKKWNSPIDATKEYYGACAQSHIVHRYSQHGDEDCLYLNIYTPSLSTNKINLKPVVVWIHGYAFITSFSHIHGPDFFIDNDVILVTVAHRVGVFGFLKLNDTDGHANMGLKDILMALKWIHKNIKQFGGDRQQITMMGSGSGASFISLLLMTKHRHLFHRLILQSGSLFSLSLFQGDNEYEKNKLNEILHQKGIRDIRRASTKDIISALRGIYSNIQNIDSQQLLVPFLPILEQKLKSSILVNDPKNINQFISKINHPILIGFGSQESITEVIPFIHNPRYLQSLATRFKFIVPFTIKCKFNHTSPTYKQVAQKIMSYYFKDGLSENSIDKFLRYSSDVIIYPIYKFIQEYVKNANNAMYVYKFNYIGNFSAIKANAVAGAQIKVKGAASGDEICYLLKCEPIGDNYVVAKSQNNNDVQFIKQITTLWTNFAKTGDPTPNTYKGNVTWPPTTLKNDNMLVLGKVINVTDAKKEKRMFEFWEEIYRKYYDHCSSHDEL